jgi:energy-coupling factor transport system permease protein
VHPLAWWVWALGLAVATTRTTDPRVTALLLAAVVVVVVVRRDDSPWARSFRIYLVLGGCIIGFRVAFHVLVGIKTPGTVVLDLPRVPLPEWMVGVQLLGPVTREGLVAAAVGGLALATLVVCFGAANALANPRRALRSLPAALHQIGSAVVIAVSVAPQLVTSLSEVRRAQRLRGDVRRGLRALPALTVPVLADALDRSLALAASMDSRGYARLDATAPRRPGGLLLLALVALALGTYGLLDGTSPAWLGVPVLLGGGLTAGVAVVLASRAVRRTRYRPDVWDAGARAVAACGIGGAVLVGWGARTPDAAGQTLTVLLATTGVLVAALPALLRTPEVAR